MDTIIVTVHAIALKGSTDVKFKNGDTQCNFTVRFGDLDHRQQSVSCQVYIYHLLGHIHKVEVAGAAVNMASL